MLFSFLFCEFLSILFVSWRDIRYGQLSFVDEGTFYVFT